MTYNNVSTTIKTHNTTPAQAHSYYEDAGMVLLLIAFLHFCYIVFNFFTL